MTKPTEPPEDREIEDDMLRVAWRFAGLIAFALVVITLCCVGSVWGVALAWRFVTAGRL